MNKILCYLIVLNLFVCQKPGTGTGLIKNIIIPGWGFSELEQNKDKSKKYILREMILWGSLFASAKTSDIFENNYISYSNNYANANVSNHNFEYSLNVGSYNSIYLYNEAMLRKRSPSSVYPENDDYIWEWASSDQRIKYKKMVQTSLDLDKVKDFTIAGLIVHRVVAAINYMYYLNKGYESGLSSVITTPDQYTLQFNFKYNLY
tara:strand:- start:100 stop:714 length:615 start_codon:yes stop_codon:yes gene_type:complete